MKKPSLQDIVLKKTFPNPKANDPNTFFGHVQRNLVPEVRLEVQIFYGSLDCLEAQYPGLDYTFDPHRRRLARYAWHRRLFRTFDELALTDNEILSLCQWEGTRSAKERYEEQTKKKIIDTTADDVVDGPVSEGPRGRRLNWTDAQAYTSTSLLHSSSMDTEDEIEQSDDDDLSTSIGVQLNHQLQAAVEARFRGENATVDAQWEQWMKEALERNELNRDTMLQAMREGRSLSNMSTSSNSLRRPRNSSGAVMPTTDTIASSSGNSAQQPHIAQQYDNLRSMLSDLQSVNHQLAADNAQMAMLLSRSQPETAR